MSGKPNKDGVASVRYYLHVIDVEEQSIERLNAEIKAAQENREAAQTRWHRAKEKKDKCMERMDLVSSGNTGYEGRMHWFLVELSRQIRTREVMPEPAEGEV